MLHLYVYILPEHIWKDIDEKEVKSFANEPGPGRHRRLRPVHRRRSTRRASSSGCEAQPELLRAPSPRSTSSSSGSSRTRTRWPRRCKRGEIDFADSLDANVFNSLENAQGITTVPGGLLRLRRDRVQHRRGTRRRHADRRRPPGAQGQARAAGHRLRDRHQDAGRQGARRLRHAGHQRHPAAVQDAALRPGRDGVHVRPRRRPTSCSTRPATRRAPTASAPMPDGNQPLKFRLFGRSSSQNSKQTRAVRRRAGSRTSASRSKTKIVSRGRAHRDHRRGQVRHVRVGLGRRARPQLPAVDVHLRQPVVQGRRQRSTPTCPTRSTATRPTTRCTPSRREQIDAGAARRDRQADAEDALRRRAVRRHRTTTTTSRPTGPTGSPASSRSPTPDGLAAVPVRHLQLPERSSRSPRDRRRQRRRRSDAELETRASSWRR